MSDQLRCLEVTLNELDEDSWNRLVQPHSASEVDWLGVMIDNLDDPSQLHFLLAYDVDRLVGGLYFWEQTNESNGASLDLVILGRLAEPARRLGFTLGPFWVCSEIGSMGPALFGDELAQAFLLRDFSQRADLAGATICLRGLSAESRARAHQSGFLSNPEFPACILPLPYQSFKDYLAKLKVLHKSTVKTMKYEEKKVQKAGIDFEELARPIEQVEQIHMLLNEHHRRLNLRSVPFGENILTANLARVLVARRDQRLVGALLFTCEGSRLRTLAVGVSESQVRSDALYPNLTYTKIIRLAIEEGVKEIDFGSQVYDMKLRRGCRLQKRFLCVRPKDRLQRLFLWLFFVLRGFQMRRKWPSRRPRWSPWQYFQRILTAM